jgi:hypothetical protein
MNESMNKDLTMSHNVFEQAIAQGNNVRDSGPTEEESKDPNAYNFRLTDERYLEGCDTRCILQFDEEKFVACVWGQSEIYIIDREKPEAVNSFETVTNPSK